GWHRSASACLALALLTLGLLLVPPAPGQPLAPRLPDQLPPPRLLPDTPASKYAPTPAPPLAPPAPGIAVTLMDTLRLATLDTLAAVAEAYFAVLRARRRLARIDETLDFLTADKPSALRGDRKGLRHIIRALVQAGGGLPGDFYRVEVDIARFQDERVIALQD